MAPDKDYVLGTHDEEVARLALQHRVWRPRALDAWRRAGFTVGQTLLDIGCGPGHASLDLAEIVGPRGRIAAIDASRRFLDTLEAARALRGLDQITTYPLDLDAADLPGIRADGAWCRWIFAFVKQPRELLSRIGRTLAPGGALVVHEYLDYGTWRLLPRSEELEGFVRVVMTSWRAAGGEPDIGRSLPGWLVELGFELKTLRPIVDVIAPSDYAWQWPKTFVEAGVRRLVDLGYLTAAQADAVGRAIAAAETASGTRMVTPTVLEIIAVRR